MTSLVSVKDDFIITHRRTRTQHPDNKHGGRAALLASPLRYCLRQVDPGWGGKDTGAVCSRAAARAQVRTTPEPRRGGLGRSDVVFSESKSKRAGADVFAEAEADLGGSGARKVGEAARDEFWDRT